MKRQRGRNNGRKPHMPVRPQNFDSSGPDVRVRGNAYQVLEKYLALARDATAGGDRVAAENYYQHAEHYYRTINANAEQHQHQQRFAQQHGGNVPPQHQGNPQGQNYGPSHGDESRGPVARDQPSNQDPGAGPQPPVNLPHGNNPGEGQNN